jgi:hypothetical protein
LPEHLQPPPLLFDAFTQAVWGRNQIAYFRDSLNEHLSLTFFAVEEEINEHLDKVTYRYVSDQYLVRDYFARTGAIITSLYAGLDYLALKLVELSGEPFDRRSVYFPISKSKELFEKQIEKKPLALISGEAKSALRSLSPWRGGNTNLSLLNELNNMVKHRQLIKIALVYVYEMHNKKMAFFECEMPFSSSNLPNEVGNRSASTIKRSIAFPESLVLCADLSKFSKAHSSQKSGGEIVTFNSSSNLHPQIGIGVVFADPPVQNLSALPTLVQFANTVDLILELFRPFFPAF